MPIIMVSMLLVCDLIKKMSEVLGNMKFRHLAWCGIWVTKQIEGTMDDDVAAKLAVGEGRQVDLEQERLELQALNNESFRYRFLGKNRPWILQHLVELVTPRSLESNQLHVIRVVTTP